MVLSCGGIIDYKVFIIITIFSISWGQLYDPETGNIVGKQYDPKTGKALIKKHFNKVEEEIDILPDTILKKLTYHY